MPRTKCATGGLKNRTELRLSCACGRPLSQPDINKKTLHEMLLELWRVHQECKTAEDEFRAAVEKFKSLDKPLPLRSDPRMLVQLIRELKKVDELVDSSIRRKQECQTLVREKQSKYEAACEQFMYCQAQPSTPGTHNAQECVKVKEEDKADREGCGGVFLVTRTRRRAPRARRRKIKGGGSSCSSGAEVIEQDRLDSLCMTRCPVGGANVMYSPVLLPLATGVGRWR